MWVFRTIHDRIVPWRIAAASHAHPHTFYHTTTDLYPGYNAPNPLTSANFYQCGPRFSPVRTIPVLRSVNARNAPRVNGINRSRTPPKKQQHSRQKSPAPRSRRVHQPPPALRESVRQIIVRDPTGKPRKSATPYSPKRSPAGSIRSIRNKTLLATPAAISIDKMLWSPGFPYPSPNPIHLPPDTKCPPAARPRIAIMIVSAVARFPTPLAKRPHPVAHPPPRSAPFTALKNAAQQP